MSLPSQGQASALDAPQTANTSHPQPPWTKADDLLLSYLLDGWNGPDVLPPGFILALDRVLERAKHEEFLAEQEWKKAELEWTLRREAWEHASKIRESLEGVKASTIPPAKIPY